MIPWVVGRTQLAGFLGLASVEVTVSPGAALLTPLVVVSVVSVVVNGGHGV